MKDRERKIRYEEKKEKKVRKRTGDDRRQQSVLPSIPQTSSGSFHTRHTITIQLHMEMRPTRPRAYWLDVVHCGRSVDQLDDCVSQCVETPGFVS